MENLPPSVYVSKGKLRTRSQCEVGGVAKTGGRFLPQGAKSRNFPVASRGDQQMITFISFSMGINPLPQISTPLDKEKNYSYFQLG